MTTRMLILGLLVATATAETCADDENWYHKRRGEDYGCDWVSKHVPKRCSVVGVMKGDADGLTVLAKDACQESCGCSYTDLDPAEENVVFMHDGLIDDYLGEAMLMDAHRAGTINYLGTMLIDADSMLPSSMDLVYKFRELHGTKDPYSGLSPSRVFSPFPWGYRIDSARMDSLDVMQAVDTEIPAIFNDANAWLTTVLEDAPEGSITLMNVAGVTPLYDIFSEKPELISKVKKMIWMAGAIDVAGNLYEPEEVFPYWPHCTEEMAWCDAGTSLAEWNVFTDPYASAWLMTEATFPITMYPLDVTESLPIPGQFMETLKSVGDDKECNDAIYDALVVCYETIAAPQPFYRLWDSGAVIYFLAPELFGEPEKAEVCIGTSWEFLSYTPRKENVDKGEPAAELLTRDGSPPACREVSLVLTLASGMDPQPVFDFAADAACAEGTGPE